jgi:hypothetical protein
MLSSDLVIAAPSEGGVECLQRRGAPRTVDRGDREIKAKARRIPLTDPIDIRCRRFETCRAEEDLVFCGTSLNGGGCSALPTKGPDMKLTTIALASVLVLGSTFALAQGAGGGAGGGSAGGSAAGTAGGSSTAGGTAGSATTTGSSMDGRTTGGAGANPNNTMSPSGNTLGPNASPSGSTLTPTGPGSGTKR